MANSAWECLCGPENETRGVKEGYLSVQGLDAPPPGWRAGARPGVDHPGACRGKGTIKSVGKTHERVQRPDGHLGAWTASRRLEGGRGRSRLEAGCALRQPAWDCWLAGEEGKERRN